VKTPDEVLQAHRFQPFSDYLVASATPNGSETKAVTETRPTASHQPKHDPFTSCSASPGYTVETSRKLAGRDLHGSGGVTDHKLLDLVAHEFRRSIDAAFLLYTLELFKSVPYGFPLAYERRRGTRGLLAFFYAPVDFTILGDAVYESLSCAHLTV
jgi:hypothetical protein